MNLNNFSAFFYFIVFLFLFISSEAQLNEGDIFNQKNTNVLRSYSGPKIPIELYYINLKCQANDYHFNEQSKISLIASKKAYQLSVSRSSIKSPTFSIYSKLGTSKVTEDSENPTTKISLVSGVGVAYLSKGSHEKDIDMYGYTAVKIYFQKPNKRKKFSLEKNHDWLNNDVYESLLNRFSFFFGAATTKIGYKGKELLNPGIQFKPVVGLSLDIAPEVSFDGGFLFFKYQKGNSNLYSELESKLSSGMFTSISIDLDLFTRLKLALKGTHYDSNKYN